MITAAQFAHSYGSFWQAGFPALENYVRLVNSGAYERSFDEMHWQVDAARSALISEVAFCLANPAYQGDLAKALNGAVQRLSGLPGVKQDDNPLSPLEEIAAKDLAARTITTARMVGTSSREILFEPTFQGYGAVFRAVGDVKIGNILIEIKAVDRGFRGTDFRQLLTYCLLNSFSGNHEIDTICLINARRGTYYSVKLNEFVFDTSASTFSDIQLRFASAVGIGGTSR